MLHQFHLFYQYYIRKVSLLSSCQPNGCWVINSRPGWWCIDSNEITLLIWHADFKGQSINLKYLVFSLAEDCLLAVYGASPNFNFSVAVIGGQFATATSTNPPPYQKWINHRAARIELAKTSHFSEISWQGILKLILTARQVETRDCPSSVFSVLVKVSDTTFHREEGGRGDKKSLLPQAHQETFTQVQHE